MLYLCTAIISSILIPVGIYWMLSKNNIKTLIGLATLGHGVNLFILCCGKLTSNKMPFLKNAALHGNLYTKQIANPLPQALILTAIVIGLAVFILTVSIIKKYLKK